MERTAPGAGLGAPFGAGEHPPLGAQRRTIAEPSAELGASRLVRLGFPGRSHCTHRPERRRRDRDLQGGDQPRRRQLDRPVDVRASRQMADHQPEALRPLLAVRGAELAQAGRLQADQTRELRILAELPAFLGQARESQLLPHVDDRLGGPPTRRSDRPLPPPLSHRRRRSVEHVRRARREVRGRSEVCDAGDRIVLEHRGDEPHA